MARHYEFDCGTLVGKVFTKVAEVDDEAIIFEEANGAGYKMCHFQDCCESVAIEDIVGDLSDLVDTPILEFREDMNEGDPKKHTYGFGNDGKEYTHVDESCTWTFYNIRTIKGSVTIRWYGSSNGYYSESVNWETYG